MLKFLLILSPFTVVGVMVVSIIAYTVYQDWKIARLYKNDNVDTKRFKNEN